MEIQELLKTHQEWNKRLYEHLQALYNMAETPQKQQKILDVDVKVSHVRQGQKKPSVVAYCNISIRTHTIIRNIAVIQRSHGGAPYVQMPQICFYNAKEKKEDQYAAISLPDHIFALIQDAILADPQVQHHLCQQLHSEEEWIV